MKENSRYLLYQITDSLFPIGAYAHSYGLETYIMNDIIKTEKDAEEYIRAYILSNMCYSDLLSIRLAYEYGKKENLALILQLEEIALVSKVAEEIRTANVKLGSRLIKIAHSLDIPYESDVFNKYSKSKEINHTYPVALGTFCASTGIELLDILERFIFLQISSYTTNCVKIIPLSQTSGQKILYKLMGNTQKIISKVMNLTEDDLFISCHGSDIRSMQHEVLYSRIFMS